MSNFFLALFWSTLYHLIIVLFWQWLPKMERGWIVSIDLVIVEGRIISKHLLYFIIHDYKLSSLIYDVRSWFISIIFEAVAGCGWLHSARMETVLHWHWGQLVIVIVIVIVILIRNPKHNYYCVLIIADHPTSSGFPPTSASREQKHPVLSKLHVSEGQLDRKFERTSIVIL